MAGGGTPAGAAADAAQLLLPAVSLGEQATSEGVRKEDSARKYTKACLIIMVCTRCFFFLARNCLYAVVILRFSISEKQLLGAPMRNSDAVTQVKTDAAECSEQGPDRTHSDGPNSS